MSAVELATAAVEDIHRVKFVLAEFDRGVRAPDAEAAAVVIRAHEEGSVEPWWVAALLGRIGHPSGYAVALAILEPESRRATSFYAEEAVARLGGAGCAVDLLPWLDEEPAERRQAAVRTLGLAGARDALRAICDAALAGRVGYRSAWRALVALDVDDATVASWLRSEDGAVVHLGCEVVFERLERGQETARQPAARMPGSELAPWVRAACERADVTLLRYEREALTTWAERAR